MRAKPVGEWHFLALWIKQEELVAMNEEIEAIIRKPDASEWLKNALEQALCRDIVDAANDAEILNNLLAQRLKDHLCSEIEAKIDAAGHSLRTAARFTGISHAQIVAIRKRKIKHLSTKSLINVAKQYQAALDLPPV